LRTAHLEREAAQWLFVARTIGRELLSLARDLPEPDGDELSAARRRKVEATVFIRAVSWLLVVGDGVTSAGVVDEGARCQRIDMSTYQRR
jgi:hypothetical protein